MINKLAGAFLGAVFAVSGISANAATYDVNLAGFQSTADFGEPGNTELFINLGAGSTITGFSYLNLSFTSFGTSYQSEFVLSVNNSDGSEFMDWSPSTIAAAGTFTTAMGMWGGSAGDAGPYGEGAPFTVLDGVVFITTYEAFDDPGVDATVSAGTLRIFYTPAASAVPEPASYALMAAGLLGVGAAARRRRS